MLRLYIGITPAVFFLAIAGENAVAQRDFSKVEIKTTHVTGKIYMLEGSGGNIGVSVGDDGVLLIDDQFAPLSEKIQAAITKLGGDKPKYVLNTHWHGDHVGGNEHFGRDGSIIAHTNVRKRLASEQKLFGRSVDPLPHGALPVITFDESLSIHFNGERIEAVHYPHGHTDGDIVIFFTKSNVVHVADDFFAGQFPFVDLEHGGDVEGLIRNIAAIIPRLPADVKIIPGHGPLSSLDDLKAYHLMLKGTTDFVRQQMAQNQTLEQIKKTGLPEKWKPWATGFISADRWIETIHQSLERKRKK